MFRAIFLKSIQEYNMLLSALGCYMFIENISLFLSINLAASHFRKNNKLYRIESIEGNLVSLLCIKLFLLQ